MSNILPQRIVSALRKQVDVSLKNYGMPCDLYILTNFTTVLSRGAYAAPSDKTFSNPYHVNVWVEWSPNMVHLKNLGMYTEDQPLPIIARFNNDLEIIVGSYIKLETQYIPDQYDGDEEFEIINIFIGPLQDMGVVKQYLLAPRRKK
jgi:hypothetical protein